MKFVDYYQVLGIAEEASEDEIRQAYRKLARKYHPDVSKEDGAEQKFKDIGEAYEVLKDPEKRAEYDQLRKYGGRSNDDFSPPPGWESAAGFGGGGYTQADAADFSDFFSEIFAGGARGSRRGWGAQAAGGSRPGEDATYRVEVELREAYAGTTRSISLQSHEIGDDGIPRPKKRTLNVKIPAGVTHGMKIRLKGQGSPGRGGGPAGDLYLETVIASDEHFSLSEKDVTLVLPVAPWEAVLGATVEVPTLGGKVNLNIPPDAQAGQKMRLKGRGLPGKPPGDQYVLLEVVVPTNLREEQKKLFEQMRDETSFDPRSHLKGNAQ